MTNQLKKAEPAQAITPTQMLSIAVEQNADLDKLQKLMDLQERWEANESRKAFAVALAEFQSKLGPIIKKQTVDYTTAKGRTNFAFANIDDIAQQIRPILDSVGLSYRFSQSQDGDSVTVNCIVSHISGHTETTALTASNDNTGGKNAIQAMASTVTYLRRYTLTGALGITTGSDDNDGGKPAITVEDLLAQIALYRDEFPSIAALKESLAISDYASAREAWGELDKDTQMQLYKAPSRGGILTTEERAKMKSNDWSAASV